MAELGQNFVDVICGPYLSSFEGVAIRYVLPVLWMTSCFHTMGWLYGASCVCLFLYSGDGITTKTNVSISTKFCSAKKNPQVYIVGCMHARVKYYVEYVCLSVCLYVRSYKPHSRTSQNFCACSMSILLWRRCNIIYTSGFVADVLFSHSGLYVALCVFPSGENKRDLA